MVHQLLLLLLLLLLLITTATNATSRRLNSKLDGSQKCPKLQAFYSQAENLKALHPETPNLKS